jgi:hypothetical protein
LIGIVVSFIKVVIEIYLCGVIGKVINVRESIYLLTTRKKMTTHFVHVKLFDVEMFGISIVSGIITSSLIFLPFVKGMVFIFKSGKAFFPIVLAKEVLNGDIFTQYVKRINRGIVHSASNDSKI